MDPMTMLIGGTVLSTGSKLLQGGERATHAKAEAKQYEIQAQQARTAAAQDEARRREELTSALETVATIRAGRSVGADSPGGMKVLETAGSNAERDIQTSKANYLTKAEVADIGAESARRRGETSLLSGFLSGGAEALTGYSKYTKIKTY